jgi:DNA-binding GntR family transcriptional regulator
VGVRSYLLGDFHVCLAECLGNSLLADTLRDFTARTTLIAMLYQSSHDAAQSCDEHVQIVDALEQGELARAEALMSAHIGSVQAALRLHASTDPLAQLRQAPGSGVGCRRGSPMRHKTCIQGLPRPAAAS